MVCRLTLPPMIENTDSVPQARKLFLLCPKDNSYLESIFLCSQRQWNFSFLFKEYSLKKVNRSVDGK